MNLAQVGPMGRGARAALVAVGVVVAAALVAAALWWATAPRAFEMRGTVTIDRWATPLPKSGGECAGFDAMADIHAGTVVSVVDELGNVLASGELAPATSLRDGVCTFPFSIQGVPTRGEYVVRVAERPVEYVDADRARGHVALRVG